MSLGFASKQLADLRHDARLLVERAGDQEGQLEALVAATDGDLRQAEAAVSHAADDLDVGDVPHLLSGQLDRSAAGFAAAKRLLCRVPRPHSQQRRTGSSAPIACGLPASSARSKKAMSAISFCSAACWQGDRAAHIVNGRTVNVATRLQQPDPQNPGQFIPLTRGKIAIEIEYAEIWFRRIEVKAI
jgi:hypothetical protein